MPPAFFCRPYLNFALNSEPPFNISKNELDFLKENSVSAFIYRVSLATEPPEIEVRSSPEVLESEIIPVSYIVKIK